MAKEELDFTNFNVTTLQSTRDAWLKDAEEGQAFPPEITRLMDWTAQHMEICDGEPIAFGIFKKKKGHAAALGICEVVVHRHSPRSKWVKMLRLHLRPSVDTELLSGDVETAMDVFVAAITGSIDLQFAHKATTLKVYGRTQPQLLFLRALVKNLQTRLEKNEHNRMKAAIEGRFLTLTYKTGVTQ
jgi:hypothetical protein